jgi:GAF domain-containing protein
MHDHALLLKSLSQFARRLLIPYDVDAVLGEFAESITGVLGLAGTGISLAADGELKLDVAIPPKISELERLQHQLQAGPCVDAYTSGEVIAIARLRDEAERWPEYCTLAERIGVSAVAGIPMGLQGTTVGVLNMYADGEHEWTEDDLAAASLMADMATGYLINASKHHQQEQLTEQLQHALDSRVVIEQAKGIVSATSGASIEEAFRQIRSHARGQNATLRSVAEAIVEGRLRV